MLDGKRKYSTHQKGDRETISVSLPLSLGECLEKLCVQYNKTRSEVVASALWYFCNSLGMKVGEK